VRRVIENLDAYLRQKRGTQGVPLAYIVRTESIPPPEAADLPFGIPTYNDDMIRRAPHYGIAYQSDNIMAWHVVRHLFHGGPGWSWIQDYQFTMDGHAAYMSVKTHYLGESFASRLRSNADAVLCDCFYDGRPKGYTFERYCEVLK
jgi:hypothetical protein